ncbi:MAG: hypothetical protein ACYTXY_09195 [Nostoc sp.]
MGSGEQKRKLAAYYSRQVLSLFLNLRYKTELRITNYVSAALASPQASLRIILSDRKWQQV